MINDCQDLTELITDYLEGSLGLVDRLLFRVHLRGCPSCRAYLDQMRRTIRAADDLPSPPIPPEVRDEMLRRFRTFRRSDRVEPPLAPGEEPVR